MLFDAPPVISTRVFARLPDAFRNKGKNTEWHRGQPGNLPEHSLLEGPAFDREGTLWCVDIPYGRIFRVSPDGEFSLALQYDGEPNGVAIHQDGRLFIADYAHGIMVYDPRTGDISPFVTRVRLERLKAVNDLVFAPNGDLYFTDQGLTGLHDPTGRVFRVRADGRVDCLLDNIPSPNGIAVDPSGTVLYVAVTRANAVWRVPLMADGTVAKVANYIQLSGGGGPDGLAVDSAGGLAVAHIGLGVVWLFDRRGVPVGRVQSAEGDHTTNIAYGGPDGKTLYITESETGQILQADMPVAGLGLYSGV
ncbi:MAG TPA: SMP-30/gluconolactonase/LRE family protein [Bordetella sp.]|nr:SMP-30/gluconolactonase/LRE family protein [Bordetella sp.]